jgi:hypothetical protein
MGLLGETNRGAVNALYDVVEVCGGVFAEEILKETLAMPEVLLERGKHKGKARTMGGKFLRLVKDRLTREQRRLLPSFTSYRWKNNPDAYMTWKKAGCPPLSLPVAPTIEKP